MPGLAYLVDTNILLRLVQTDSPNHVDIRDCCDLLWARGAALYYTSQNLAEFWNVCTRPIDRNGLGISIVEADRRVTFIEQQLQFAPDSESTHRAWRRIVFEEMVAGVQVHDARLAAAMQVHGIPHILTLNGKDFKRFQTVVVVSPAEILRSR